MSWKTGDYFGSSNCPLDEIQHPIVTLCAPDGTSTRIPFSEPITYQEFLIWATWDLLSHGYTMSVHKELPISEYPHDEHSRCDAFMDEFKHYRNETV